MKYNPKWHEDVAKLPGFTSIHPYQPIDSVQGALQLMFELQEYLAEITGMSATSLAPMAGAQGELASILMIKAYYHLPYDRTCMHEVIFSGKRQKAKGAHTIDIAKRLLDYGFHPSTVYFSLVVDEALMTEPNETESKETLDAYIDAMKKIAREAVENALGRPRKVEYRAVPSVVYTYPVVAGVGITEKKANDSGFPYKVSKFPFLICGRAVAMDETMGIVKMICDAKNGKVLGMHIMGPHADDLIVEGALAIQLGATARDIAHTIHAHPTLPEAVLEAAMGQLEGSIHFRRI